LNPPPPLTPPQTRAEVKSLQDTEGELTYALAYDARARTDTDTRERPGPFDAWVCAPGVPGTERDFRHLTPHLTPTAPVARVVFPGFGPLSHLPARACPSSSEERARYLSRVISAEGWERVGLIGHSMGGAAALALAASDPRVARLCLVCSVGLRPHRAMRFSAGVARALVALTRAPLLGPALASVARAQLKAMGFHGHPLHAEQIRLIYQHVAALDWRAARHNIEALPTTLDARLIWTADDPLIEEGVSEELSDALRARLPSARLLRLEVGGHVPQKSAPERVAEALC
jgi:pimeloyl-ACP methyl ester carboxylesterase